MANRVMEFPFAIILGFGQGYQPVVGFNWGAKNWRRVWQSYSFATRTAIVGGVIMGTLILVAASPIVHIFNSQADTEVLRLGILCIRAQCLVLWIHAWVLGVNGIALSQGIADLVSLLIIVPLSVRVKKLISAQVT